MMRMMFLAAAFAAISVSAAAQYPLTLVEGAACAQSSAFIEELGRYNDSTHNEIGELQAVDDRKKNALANALILHFDRMKAFRQNLISDYEIKCAHGTMKYSELKAVCSPQPGGDSFEDTVFCKPLKDAAQ